MGLSPSGLPDILLTLMRWHWAAGEEAESVALARVAAPFVHPRAQAPCASIHLAEADDDELDLRCPAGGADAAARDTEQLG